MAPFTWLPRRALAAAAIAALVSTVTACQPAPALSAATGADAPLATWVPAAPPSNEVVARGPVIERDDSTVICLDAAPDTDPLNDCAGALPLRGWSWEGLEGVETTNEVTWGGLQASEGRFCVIRGRFDGTALTVTSAPPPYEMDAGRDFPVPVEPGPLVAASAVEAHAHELLGDGYVATTLENGRALVRVIWDDGALQRAFDEEHGAGAVIVRPLLEGTGDETPPAPTLASLLGSPEPTLPSGEVQGWGTVIERDGGPQLCLAGELQSLPPQCVGGLVLSGWEWEAVDGWEEVRGVRFGGPYAVSGTFDGAQLEVSDTPSPPPHLTETEFGGHGDEATLLSIQERLLGAQDMLISVPDLGWGYLRISVIWDDGTLQRAADAVFGPGLVRITSALSPVE
ncbi:hypothetical protein JOD62_002758 [Microbacterium keratanolyticum]|uniref:Uncharacterized protein n=1 Tax=Microbacterium keratanolyticum TaxID=67574 RepID=A0A9W6M9K6_9MICO|nr:hypothetical protein [Microbacterium keratanolyticum]MBM7470210.1 hypothetical protein [Microbacterium keratanolyticum]GLK02289.1 hypothetical protein GCM10017596_20040 [Microbacterium keratanolyticum]